MVTMGVLPYQGKIPGNRTRDLMISSQKRLPLYHEAYREVIRNGAGECTGTPSDERATEY
jgi:hypothetical protein